MKKIKENQTIRDYFERIDSTERYEVYKCKLCGWDDSKENINNDERLRDHFLVHIYKELIKK